MNAPPALHLVMLGVSVAAGVRTLAPLHGTDPAATDIRAASYAARQAIPPAFANRTRTVAVSRDGRFVAFESLAALVPEDRNGDSDIYVLDRASGTLTLESVASHGGAAAAASHVPSLSADGRYLVFESDAGDIDPATHNQFPDVFLRDRVLRTTRRLSALADGSEANGRSVEGVISADGRTVGFVSAATNLVQDTDTNDAPDVFIASLATGDQRLLKRVSVPSDRTTNVHGGSVGPSLSGDGRVVAFSSNVVLDPVTPGCASTASRTPAMRVYARREPEGTITCVDGDLRRAEPEGRSYAPSVSGDGRFVAFVFDAVPATEPHRSRPQVYVRDLQQGTTMLVSRTARGRPGNAMSAGPSISSDGRYIAFFSEASDLATSPACGGDGADRNLLPDVYLFDVASATACRLSGNGMAEWWTPSIMPSIDGAGHTVAFSSRQPQGPDDLDIAYDVFLWSK